LRIDDSPNELQLRNKRAALFLYMERNEESRKEINTMLEYNPQFGPAILTKATLMSHIGEVDSAYQLIQQALDSGPEIYLLEGLYGLKGKLQIKEGKFKAAEKSLFRAVSSPKVSIDTMKDLAFVLNHNGKNDEAAVVLKETLEIFGHHIASYINTGYVCNKLGFYDEALAYLGEALSIEPNNPIALSNLAESYLRIGKVEEALQTANKSLVNDNTNAYAFKIKGESLLQLGENSKACAEFTKAIQMGYSTKYDPEEIITLVLESFGFDG